MAIDDEERYVEPAVEIVCSRCGSENVILCEEEGYFWVCFCKKCGYSKEKS